MLASGLQRLCKKWTSRIGTANKWDEFLSVLTEESSDEIANPAPARATTVQAWPGLAVSILTGHQHTKVAHAKQGGAGVSYKKNTKEP